MKPFLKDIQNPGQNTFVNVGEFTGEYIPTQSLINGLYVQIIDTAGVTIQNNLIYDQINYDLSISPTNFDKYTNSNSLAISYVINASANHGGVDRGLMKYNSNGTISWSHVQPSTNSYVDVLVDKVSSSNIFTINKDLHPVSGIVNILVKKFDASTGAILKEVFLTSSNPSTPIQIIQDEVNTEYIYILSQELFIPTSKYTPSIYKIDKNTMQVVWSYKYNYVVNNELYEIIPKKIIFTNGSLSSPTGGTKLHILCGITVNNTNYCSGVEDQIVLMKVDATNGTWNKSARYDNTSNGLPIHSQAINITKYEDFCFRWFPWNYGSPPNMFEGVVHNSFIILNKQNYDVGSCSNLPGAQNQYTLVRIDENYSLQSNNLVRSLYHDEKNDHDYNGICFDDGSETLFPTSTQNYYPCILNPFSSFFNVSYAFKIYVSGNKRKGNSPNGAKRDSIVCFRSDIRGRVASQNNFSGTKIEFDMSNEILGEELEVNSNYENYDLQVENVNTTELQVCDGIIPFNEWMGSHQQNKISLKFPDNQNTKKKIFNMQGKYLGEYLIDDLSSGLYIIQENNRNELKMIRK